MNFEDKTSFFKVGKLIGFILAYFVFTTMLFFVYSFIKKLENPSYINYMIFTLIVTLVAILNKRYLE